MDSTKHQACELQHVTEEAGHPELMRLLLTPPHATVDDALVHANFVQASHRLGNVILQAIERKLAFIICGHIRDGGGVVRIEVNATARAGWKSWFVPADGSDAVLLASSGTNHAEVHRGGIAMLETLAPLLAAAVHSLDDDERAAVMLALGAGTHAARVVVHLRPSLDDRAASREARARSRADQVCVVHRIGRGVALTPPYAIVIFKDIIPMDPQVQVLRARLGEITERCQPIQESADRSARELTRAENSEIETLFESSRTSKAKLRRESASPALPAAPAARPSPTH